MDETEGVKKLQKLDFNTSYTYGKTRSNFGRWCNFQDQNSEIIIDIPPDPKISKLFVDVEHVEQGVMAIVPMSWKEVNTSYIKNTDTGINHVEGGWPKDISYLDEQQTTRYHKKAKREESYVPTMNNLCNLMESCINQNNSLDIYQKYFDDEPTIEQHCDISSHVFVNLWDHSGQKRSVSGLAWHPVDGVEKLAVVHCDLDYSEVLKPCYDSYIWRIENSFEPEITLTPGSPMLTMEYNYKDVYLLAGGQYNGQVVFFDIRKSSKPISFTNKEVSHLEPVNSLQWVQSKTGFECFTTSSDGQVLWWDMRNLQECADQMCIDPTRQNNIRIAEGGVTLEYTSTAPTKFMVGTEQGNVYSCTRRAKQPGEKIGQPFSEHTGPVYLLQRNNHVIKTFLTVGDYHADIWCEDFPHSPVWKTPMYNTHILHGGWSPPRPSLFYLCRADGSLDVWDLMCKQNAPEYSVQLSNDRLYCCSIEEKGEFVAVGSESGKSFILQMSSEAYEMQSNEKNFFLSMMDRESRREKFIMDKERENKVIRTDISHYYAALNDKEEEEMEELVKQVTENFYAVIDEETKKMERIKKIEMVDIEHQEEAEEEEEEEDSKSCFGKAQEMPDDFSLPMYNESDALLNTEGDQPDALFEDFIIGRRSQLEDCNEQVNDCTARRDLPSKPDCFEGYGSTFNVDKKPNFEPRLIELRKTEMKEELAKMYEKRLADNESKALDKSNYDEEQWLEGDTVTKEGVSKHLTDQFAKSKLEDESEYQKDWIKDKYAAQKVEKVEEVVQEEKKEEKSEAVTNALSQEVTEKKTEPVKEVTETEKALEAKSASRKRVRSRREKKHVVGENESEKTGAVVEETSSTDSTLEEGDIADPFLKFSSLKDTPKLIDVELKTVESLEKIFGDDDVPFIKQLSDDVSTSKKEQKGPEGKTAVVRRPSASSLLRQSVDEGMFTSKEDTLQGELGKSRSSRDAEMLADETSNKTDSDESIEDNEEG